MACVCMSRQISSGRTLFTPRSLNTCGSGTEPIGTCASKFACNNAGGETIPNMGCNDFLSVCCKYVAVGSATVPDGAGVVYWESPNYPDGNRDSSMSELVMTPTTDACFIRIEFIDTTLTAPELDVCNSNFMTILNQAEGDGSILCSQLNTYETFVKPKSSDSGGYEPLRFVINSRESSFKYLMKLTEVKCSQINGIADTNKRRYYLRDLKKSSNVEKVKKPEKKRESQDLNLSMETFQKLKKFINNFETRKVSQIKERSADVKNETASRVSAATLRGANDVGATEAPYYGWLISKSDEGQYKFCGSVLVDDQWALTAASCVLRNGYEPGSYKIRATFPGDGDMGLTQFDEIYERDDTIEVDKVIFHPMYDHNLFNFDVAVIHLATAPPDATIIRLPEKTDVFDNQDAATVVNGIGVPSRYNANALANQARKSLGKIVPNSECSSAYNTAPVWFLPTHTNDFINDNMLCYEREDVQHQFCKGDAGSPMVINFNSPSATLVGLITGNVHNCAERADYPDFTVNSYPDVGLKITSVLDFIDIATTDLQFDTVSNSDSARSEFLQTIFFRLFDSNYRF